MTVVFWLLGIEKNNPNRYGRASLLVVHVSLGSRCGRVPAEPNPAA